MMLSIIIPIRFHPDLTRVCIDSVLRYTKPPFEVILVRDGADPEMDDLLEQYGGDNVKLICHEEPKGYPGAINAGYALVSSEAEYVILLNSDTVVIPDWDVKLIGALRDNGDVGLVGPILTERSGWQAVDARTSGTIPVPMVKGAVICMPISVCQEIAPDGQLLDERFGMGGGDDNDLSQRVQNLGLKTAICHDAYVYHYSSAAFRELFENDAEYSKRYATGRFFQYRRKWSGDKAWVHDNHPSVFVALPCVDGFVWNELALHCMAWLKDRDMNISVRPYPFMAPLDSARNTAVYNFMQDYYDYIFFCDADVVPPPDAIHRLILHGKDIVGALCLTFRHDDQGVPFPYPAAFKRNHEGYKIHYGKDLEEVDVIGGGAFLVSRRVFEAIKRPFAFTYDEYGRVEHSEDFYFCMKAKEAGFKIYMDYGCQCKHIRPIDVKGINRLLVMQNGG